MLEGGGICNAGGRNSGGGGGGGGGGAERLDLCLRGILRRISGSSFDLSSRAGTLKLFIGI